MGPLRTDGLSLGLAIGVVAGLAVGCAGERREAAPETRRIVAVAPALVEMLFAVGAGERVVGVGDYTAWPPEAAELPRIGGLYDARLETIVELAPDLGVLLPSEAELGHDLERLGIEVLTVELETLDDVSRAARALGERLGVADEAAALIGELERALAPEPLPGAPDVALVLARQPGRLADLLTAGRGTFLDELVSRLGAGNAFADAAVRYPQVGLEAMLQRRPRAVVELQPETVDEPAARALAGEWLAVEGLELEPRCVAVISGSHVLLPGPRLPRLATELRRALEGCVEAGTGR